MSKRIEDTGWKPITITGGDGEQAAGGRIEMIKGTEERPCLLCRHFEKDTRRLTEHLLAHKLTAEPDGTFVTPIAKDFPGRQSMRLDPKQMGFCRKDCIAVQDLATCPAWSPVRTNSELQSRIK